MISTGSGLTLRELVLGCSVLFSLGPGIAPAALAQDRPVTAADRITADVLLHRIGTLAHDSMGGRDTPSPELERAAAWIAAEFHRYRLAPGGDDGSFIQRYPLHRARLVPARSFLSIGGSERLEFDRDAAWVTGGRGGVAGGRVVVLAGPQEASRLETIGVRGATVLVLAGTTPQGSLPPQAQILLTELLRQQVGVVVFAANFADSVWTRYETQQRRVMLSAPWQDMELAPVLVARDSALAPILARHGVDVAAIRGSGATYLSPAPDLSITATIATEVLEAVDAPNVVGILEGADPALRDEYVVYTAHMDHIGIAGSESGCHAQGADTICNGADDNASGAAVIMTIAEALAAEVPRPRRSIAFVLVSGEEHGLRGSDWFARRPPDPIGHIDRIVAALNADNVARNRPDALFAIGRRDSDLGLALQRVAEAHEELGITSLLDLSAGQEGFYYRSDHYSFARRGVPAIFFSTGIHTDYHQPTDDVGRVDADKAARIGRLMLYLGRDIADADARPQWEPESARRIVVPMR